MSLTKQCHLYAIATDAFYNQEEQKINNKLLKLYRLKNNTKYQSTKESSKRLVKKYKKQLTEMLNESLNNSCPRILNIEALKDKSIISLFESALTRMLKIQTNELTTEIIIINVFYFQIFESIVKNGFLLNGEKYIFLTASAGQIRTKRAVFIKESSYEKIKNKLMCGLTVEGINEQGGINPNKYLAYLALSNSATEVWEDFDIDKSIVVDDFETMVEGEVDFIDENTYEITRKRMNVPIPHMDGCGIMLDGPTRMVRLSWIKGLLVHFPFDEFIREKCPGGKCIVTDIYGEEHDILGEGIRYIFTKSQFKLH